MRKLSKDWIACICCCVFMVMSIGYCVITASGFTYKDIDSQIQDLRTKTDQQVAVNTASEQETKIQASGLDLSRVNSDDKAAETFFKKVLTWASLDEYETARESVISEYGLSDAKDFLDTFFPENAVITDDSGKVIDSKLMSGEVLNMQYVGMVSHVTDIQGDDYQYFTEVTVSSQAGNGGVATGSCIFLYTMTKDQKIKDLRAYVVAV